MAIQQVPMKRSNPHQLPLILDELPEQADVLRSRAIIGRHHMHPQLVAEELRASRLVLHLDSQ